MDAGTSQDVRAAGDMDQEEYRSTEELNETIRPQATNEPENLQEMVKTILTKVGSLHDEFQTIRQWKDNTSHRLGVMEEVIDTKFNQVKDQIEEGQRRCRRERDEIIRGVEERLDNELEGLRWEIENRRQGMLPQAAMDTKIIESLKYAGYRRNPMMVLEEFEERTRGRSEQEKLGLIGEVLVEAARDWWEVTKSQVVTWEDFRRLFKARFWNEYAQNNVVRKLEGGRYNWDRRETIAEYIFHLLAEAKYLEPRMDDYGFIYRIRKHFGRAVEGVMIQRGIRTIAELTNLAYELEGERDYWKMRGEASGRNGQSDRRPAEGTAAPKREDGRERPAGDRREEGRRFNRDQNPRGERPREVHAIQFDIAEQEEGEWDSAEN